MKHKVLVILLCCIMLFINCDINIAKAEVGLNIPDGYKVLAETANLGLYYNQEQRFIAVVDKRNGFIWGSPSALGQLNNEKFTPKLIGNMQALFNFSYANIEKNKGQIVQTNCVSEKAEVRYGNIENGISLTYDFTNLGISISIEVYMDNDSLIFHVPADKIIESGEWGLVSLEVLPFFGASEIGEDGYIFYPDGSGALLYLDEKPKDLSKYSFYIYGTDAVDFREYREENYVMLPVFGIKNRDNAFLAIIKQGDSDTCINLYPSGYIVDLNRISPEFTYRRLYRDPRSDEKILYKIEKNIIRSDREVEYRFLNGNEANYSGMANTYREYLIENNKLNKSIDSDDPIPVGLDFFMGIKEERILFDKFILATTFQQVRTVLDMMLNEGVKSIDVNLIGWQKGGYGEYHIPPAPDRHLGGTRGLEKLSEYALENNLRLYLQCNLTDITNKSKGFTPRKDMVYQANGMVVTNARRTRYLLNAAAAWNKFIDKYLPIMKRYSISGLNFEFFGSNLYYDYNSSWVLSRQQTSQYWNKIMRETKNEFGYAAVQGGNAYVLENVNRLFNIPTKDNGYFITSESVPFYQMVVHGLIPYTSSQPGNLFYDFPKQKLKWVEYGYMPYFELTYKESSVLKNTDYNRLFSSHYKDWADTVVEVYKEFNQRLGGTWPQAILKHEKVSNDVYLVTYEDGTKVYINYKMEPVQIDGNTINGLDYLVIDKEGNKR